MTRQEVINILHDRLGVLATTAGLTAVEADYGNALDVALRTLYGSTQLPADADLNLNDLLEVFESAMLRKLLNFYSFYVDTQVGPRREQYSQLLRSVQSRVRYPVVTAPGATYLPNQYSNFTIDWFEINGIIL